jgi:hypothetical protein
MRHERLIKLIWFTILQLPRGYGYKDTVYARVTIEHDGNKVAPGTQGRVIGPSDPYDMYKMRVEFVSGKVLCLTGDFPSILVACA